MMGSTNRSSSWLNWAQAPREQGGLGLAPHQAAGVVGNLVKESGDDLNPWGPSGDNKTAWGTAQWREDRLRNLQQMHPDTYQTMEAQQAFMRHEMDTTHNGAYQALRAATTPEEAATVFNRKYEISADNTGGRERAARQFMTQFGGDTASAPGALTSSYAPTESKKSMPALSADNVFGDGALSTQPTGGSGDKWADGLSGIGAAIAGIMNPDQARAINQSIALRQKTAVDQGTWSTHVMPNGQAFMLNSKTQQMKSLGNYAKPEADEYTKEADKTAAKSNGELGDQINQNARDSAAQGQTVSELRAAFSDPNLKQGVDGPARQFLNKTFVAMGFGDAATASAAANGDIASALSNKLALQLVNSGGVKLLPGSFSDSDRKFVTQMATSLSNDPAANQRLLDIYERSNKYVQQAEDLRAEHVNANGGRVMPGFRKELSDLSVRQAEEAKAEAAARTSVPAASTTTAPAPGSAHVWTPGKGIRPK